MKVCVFGVGAVGGQVQAFAGAKGVAVPTIDTLLPLLRGLDRALRRSRAS
jgi:ketopantoate reductase